MIKAIAPKRIFHCDGCYFNYTNIFGEWACKRTPNEKQVYQCCPNGEHRYIFIKDIKLNSKITIL
jgi:hypothetical protein